MATNDKLILCSALKRNICVSQNNPEDLINHDGRLFIAIELINRAFNETPAVEVKDELKWISVKDRLPEKGEYLDCMLVLKVGDSYVIDCGGWTCSIGFDENRNKVETWGWWVNNDWDEGQGCVVQYWMQYPDLPKEIESKLISGYEN